MKLLIAAAALFASLSVNAAEILSGEVNYEEQKITLEVSTINHCTNPRYNGDFMYMNKAIWGPYHYSLKETPILRIRCMDRKTIKVEMTFDKVFNGVTPHGLVVLHADNASSFEFFYPEDFSPRFDR